MANCVCVHSTTVWFLSVSVVTAKWSSELLVKHLYYKLIRYIENKSD